MSDSQIVEFVGARREPAPTHTFAGAMRHADALWESDSLAREVLDQLRALDQHALKYVAAALTGAGSSTHQDPLVELVAGPPASTAIPNGDRHTAFLLQQYA